MCADLFALLQVFDAACTQFACDVVAPRPFFRQFADKDVVIYVHGAITTPKFALWETQLLEESLQAAAKERDSHAQIKVLPFMWPCSRADLLDSVSRKYYEYDLLPSYLSRYRADYEAALASSAAFHSFLTAFLEGNPPPDANEEDTSEDSQVLAPRSVTVVAHSMGNLVLLQGIKDAQPPHRM